jgi:hypothetical protein
MATRVNSTRLRIFSVMIFLLSAVAPACGGSTPASNGSQDSANLYVRIKSRAESASNSCREYFASIAFLANSGGSKGGKEQLQSSLVDLSKALIDINTTVLIAPNNKSLIDANLEIIEMLSNQDSATKEEAEEFLTFTVKTECEKWKRFSMYSMEQMKIFVERDFPLLIQNVSSLLCEDAKSELQTIDTKNLFEVVQCEAQEYKGRLDMVIVLSDWSKSEWMKKIGANPAPTTQDLEEWIFDIPLQMLSGAFSRSGLDPISFDSIVVAFRDDVSTVYELVPSDVSLALQSSSARETLLILRQKMQITSTD